MLLVVAPIVGTQRASMLASAVSIGFVIVAALGATWRRRSPTTVAQIGFLIGGVALMLVAFVGIRVGFGAEAPLSDRLDQTFRGDGQQVAAASRLDLWSQSADLIRERPVLGWGLGKQLDLPRLSLTESETTQAPAHNLDLDILIRSGFVGLVLFLTALLLTAAAGWRTWRNHPDTVVAAFALGCLAAITGLLAKGMVESIFEQFRIATVLGFLLGGVLSVARSASVATARPAASSELPITVDADRSAAAL